MDSLEIGYHLSSVSDAILCFDKLKAEYSEDELKKATLFVGSTFTSIPNQTLNVCLANGEHIALLTVQPHHKIKC